MGPQYTSRLNSIFLTVIDRHEGNFSNLTSTQIQKFWFYPPKTTPYYTMATLQESFEDLSEDTNIREPFAKFNSS